MNDRFRDECGVIGIWGEPDAVQHLLIGLTALQHRGQDSSGIAASNGRDIMRVCALGKVTNLAARPALEACRGHLAIGHVRYATVGLGSLVNAQPILMDCRQGRLALCHNGQLVHDEALRRDLARRGARWTTRSDSEVILQACHFSEQAQPVDAIADALARVDGAFSLLMMTRGELVAARDPFGFRPLSLGQAGRAVVVASETCALDALGADYLREVEPGEITVIGESGIRSVRYAAAQRNAHCVFEHVYFARPDSDVFGQNVGAVRLNLGRNLAREAAADADIVVPIPDSGFWVAIGYQQASGIPLQMGLVRNSYVGRIFIEPRLRRQSSMSALKLNVVRNVVRQKRVVLIDDSIVRGETMMRIVAMVRRAGAREVHVRIGGPATIAPCFYGINTPTRAELVAAGRSVDEVRRIVGADTLEYLSLQGLLDAVGPQGSSYCTACYSEDYRVHPGLARRPVAESRACERSAAVLPLLNAGRPVWPTAGAAPAAAPPERAPAAADAGEADAQPAICSVS